VSGSGLEWREGDPLVYTADGSWREAWTPVYARRAAHFPNPDDTPTDGRKVQQGGSAACSGAIWIHHNTRTWAHTVAPEDRCRRPACRRRWAAWLASREAPCPTT